MSEKLPQQPENEEVDLGQLFNAIGNLFQKLFNFIVSIFKGILSLVVYALKPIVNNFKIVAIILGVAILAGYIVEKYNTPIYASAMVVKPYFESKYELNNNVSYFNSLIGSHSINELAEVFEIDTITAKELLSFDVKLGPETQNEVLKEYGEYMKSIDTSLVKGISYDMYLENRDIYSGSVFTITAKAKRNNIFKGLEKGIIKTFENSYSKKLKQRADSIYQVQKSNYLEELKRTETLQDVYIEIKKKEANNGQISIASGSLLPLSQEKATTKEFELFQEELKIRNSLRILEERKYEDQDMYDILAAFDEVGSREHTIYNKYTLVFPIAIFVLIIMVFIILKTFKFIKEYE